MKPKKPEWEDAHREDTISQYDNYVMSGKTMEEHGGYRPTNLGHGNECSECNDAILGEMTRTQHFDKGTTD